MSPSPPPRTNNKIIEVTSLLLSISNGPKGGESSNLARKRCIQTLNIANYVTKCYIEHLTFLDGDRVIIELPHNDGFVITLNIFRDEIRKVLFDMGCFCDIFMSAFKNMRIDVPGLDKSEDHLLVLTVSKL